MKKPILEENAVLSVQSCQKLYGINRGCQDINFDLYPGEVLGIVGESGSGKSTLLNCLSGNNQPDHGAIIYRDSVGMAQDIYEMNEARRRLLMRSEFGIVKQNPKDGLRMRVSAGANIGERLMAVGDRHYGNIRTEAGDWLTQVEMPKDRLDDMPFEFSGGMQQRLQIARVLVTRPRLVLMDEPTGGLDVSVQAKLLDLIRSLVSELNLSVIMVTHDLAVARLLCDRLLVMQQSRVIEQGLTDQVLDDPQHPYTQLLVSSVLTP
uniref:COG4107 ABC-type phosphonate transport system, ATPase component n=1 Tax=uncultured bacterium B3TF_MPn1 TaxID=1439866 RepID=W0NU16_9BACT|nr:COG4107 ABC-type phosphonate transport system, ATPase component [uncultured bacterium B3TF_MPn1]